MLRVLAERNLPITELIPVASAKSEGKEIVYKGKTFYVTTLEKAVAMKPDLALFSAGGGTSLEWAPKFAEVGTTPDKDVLMELSYDGKFDHSPYGLAIISANKAAATQARAWLEERLKPNASRDRALSLLLAMWAAMAEGRRIGSDIKAMPLAEINLQGLVVELALLDRKAPGRVKYRSLTQGDLH